LKKIKLSVQKGSSLLAFTVFSHHNYASSDNKNSIGILLEQVMETFYDEQVKIRKIPSLFKKNQSQNA